MHLGGIQKLSLSDYPGKVCAVIFTQGCNYRCPFCHNQQLLASVAKSGGYDTNDILDYLTRRKDMLEGVVLSGGEPTLQDDLASFAEHIKRLGLSVKLDTNGSRPEMLQTLFAGKLVDYVAMDIKAPYGKYSTLAGVKVDVAALNKSVELIVTSGVAHHFRTTWVEKLLGENDLAEILSIIPPQSSHVLQPFCPENALDKELFQSILNQEKSKLPPSQDLHSDSTSDQ